MTSRNSAANGVLDAPARTIFYKGKPVVEAGPLPALQSYIGGDGKAKVILDCFRHYTRIMQDDIGRPEIDLSCAMCTKRKGK